MILVKEVMIIETSVKEVEEIDLLAVLKLRGFVREAVMKVFAEESVAKVLAKGRVFVILSVSIDKLNSD